MKELVLSQGRTALLDEFDYERVSRWKWTAASIGSNWYALRVMRGKGKSKTVYLHRHLLNPPKGYLVDHINGSSLDNRRKNLRICSVAQNAKNRGIDRRNTSGYKGVTRINDTRRKNVWKAQLATKDKLFYLGCFASPVEAARMYNMKAKEIFGEFARLNKI